MRIVFIQDSIDFFRGAGHSGIERKKWVKRHKENNTIIVIGDSHTYFFSGQEVIRPRKIGYHYGAINSSENLLPEFSPIHIGPVLAYNANTYGTKTRGREKVDYLIKKRMIERGDRVLFCYGEIDVGNHVVRQAVRTQQDSNVIYPPRPAATPPEEGNEKRLCDPFQRRGGFEISSEEAGSDRPNEIPSEGVVPSRPNEIPSVGEVPERRGGFTSSGKCSNQEIAIERVVDKVLANYLSFLVSMRDKGFRVACWGPTPSFPDTEHPSDAFPAHGGEITRNKATLYFNEQLKNLCQQNDLVFVSIAEKLIDERGRIRYDYFVDGCHLNQKVWSLVTEEQFKFCSSGNG
jgi:hypothetical protein